MWFWTRTKVYEYFLYYNNFVKGITILMAFYMKLYKNHTEITQNTNNQRTPNDKYN